MIPGPTELSNNVINTLSQQVKPHYGDDWKKIYKETKLKLKKIFYTSQNIFIFSGSGTIAMEIAISSLLAKNDEVLVCHNGYWAERLYEICKSWKLKINMLKEDFNKPILPNKVLEILKKNKKIKLVLLVHVDTSTGIINPLEEIAKIVKKNKVFLLVDSVAGLAGTEIKTDKWKIDFLVTSSQKCLGSPAGLGIMSVSNDAIKIIKKKSYSKQFGWSLNLINILNYKKKWSSWHPHGPTTAPVSIYLALNVAMDNLIKEKLINVFKRHERIKKYIRDSIRLMELKLYIADDKYASPTITTFLLPKGINSIKFVQKIKKNYSILLSRDLDYVHKNLIRIGNMGNQANMNYAKRTIRAIKNTLKNW